VKVDTVMEMVAGLVGEKEVHSEWMYGIVCTQNPLCVIVDLS
jgi:hypothetical protein